MTKQLSRGHRISKTRMHPAEEHVDREVGDLLDKWIRDHDAESATLNDDLLLINASEFLFERMCADRLARHRDNMLSIAHRSQQLGLIDLATNEFREVFEKLATVLTTERKMYGQPIEPPPA